MNKKPKSSRNLKIIGVIIIATLIILTALLFVPVSTVRVGECGGVKSTRLSFIKGDLKKIEAAKEEARDRRAKKAEVLKQNPGLAMGCSIGPTYQLYLL